MTPINADWKLWLDGNLRRGCSEASMADSMVRAGIDEATARQWLHDAQSAPPAPNGAKPMLPAAAKPDGYVIGTVRLPQSGNLIRTGDRDVRVALRMSQPVLAVFDDLLSAQECDELVRMSANKLRRSTVVDQQTTFRRHLGCTRRSEGPKCHPRHFNPRRQVRSERR